MSMLRPKTRIAITACIALVQLTVLPATYVLHIGCEHRDCAASDGTVECGHGDCCPFHHHDDQDEDKSNDGGHHHDSDECRVCQAAFASIIASPEVARLACCGTVAILSQSTSILFDSIQPHCHPGRGPPA